MGINEKLPDEYEPGVRFIRNILPRTSMYGIGYLDNRGGVGMEHGPCPDLQPMLDTLPRDIPGAVIIYFEEDGTDTILYKWHRGKGRWVLWGT